KIKHGSQLSAGGHPAVIGSFHAAGLDSCVQVDRANALDPSPPAKRVRPTVQDLLLRELGRYALPASQIRHSKAGGPEKYNDENSGQCAAHGCSPPGTGYGRHQTLTCP